MATVYLSTARPVPPASIQIDLIAVDTGTILATAVAPNVEQAVDAALNLAARTGLYVVPPPTADGTPLPSPSPTNRPHYNRQPRELSLNEMIWDDDEYA